jgi:hypothetical protein
MKETKNDPKSLSRRDLLRIGAAAASCTALGGRTLGGEARTPVVTPTQASGSVFEDDCRDGNKKKYDQGDLAVLGGLLAMWLMLTTDEWSSCLSDPNWRARLAIELDLDSDDLEAVYTIAMDDTPYINPKNNFKYSNKEAFIRVRKKWSDFISNPRPKTNLFYGARPCPGGNTLLKIAKLVAPKSSGGR